LTSDGQEKMKEIFPQHSKSIYKLFENFSEDELSQFIELLKKAGYTAEDLLEK